MVLTLSHKENKEVREFYYAYCNICQEQVNGIIKKYKGRHLSSLKVEDLIDNWDFFSISTEFLDLVGCVIPDAEKDPQVCVGLNGRKYLQRPCEHLNKFHKHKNTAPGKDESD